MDDLVFTEDEAVGMKALLEQGEIEAHHVIQLIAAINQLQQAEYGTNAWAESWDNLEAAKTPPEFDPEWVTND